MQVKKFEARTMKEALEMVKDQLGPDAIILSARDNNKSYGLVGEGSVEITAAVSEETLQKKRFTESRLREQDREKFARSPARQQKELITKMVDHHKQKNQAPAPITQRRYIDIDDEQDQRRQQSQQSQQQTRVLENRVRAAAQYNGQTQGRSGASAQNVAQKPTAQKVSAQMAAVAQAPTVRVRENEEVLALKNEIEGLRKVISQFQQMPQSFAGTHPGADYGLPFDLSAIFEKLTRAGMAPEIAGEILTKAHDSIPALKMKNKSLVEAWVARYMLDHTRVVENPGQGKVHCFVGPAGAGKTSALVKMASQLVVREGKKVALFTTDSFKVGAADQMRIYAQILNVPFSMIRGPADWMNLMRYIANVDCVLVDYTGLSLKNVDEINMIRNLLPPQNLQAQCHLVLPASVKDQDATELGRRYSVLGYQDVIFTGLDESSQHGTIYNFMKRFDIPLHSFGIGARVPEDFEYATKERVLDLIFKITQLQSSSKESQAV